MLPTDSAFGQPRQHEGLIPKPPADHRPTYACPHANTAKQAIQPHPLP